MGSAASLARPGGGTLAPRPRRIAMWRTRVHAQTSESTRDRRQEPTAKPMIRTPPAGIGGPTAITRSRAEAVRLASRYLRRAEARACNNTRRRALVMMIQPSMIQPQRHQLATPACPRHAKCGWMEGRARTGNGNSRRAPRQSGPIGPVHGTSSPWHNGAIGPLKPRRTPRTGR